MSEPQWIDKTTNVERVYMFRNWEGLHYEASDPRDTTDVAEMYRDITTTSGTILGYFPELGDVYAANGEMARTVVPETGSSSAWVRIESDDTPTNSPS